MNTPSDFVRSGNAAAASPDMRGGQAHGGPGFGFAGARAEPYGLGGIVPDYDALAPFYDAAMGDPGARLSRVLEAVRRYRPGAVSLLELGCGTGAILSGLTSIRSLTGLDRSSKMLDIARNRVPTARLLVADMASFDLRERFDVVICVFDTLNHLPNFDRWRKLFDQVHRHLKDDGLFVFDVNPIGELRRLAHAPPWIEDFDRFTLVMDVECDSSGLSTWDIQVFEPSGGDQFTLRHERIVELGVELGRIEDALATCFDVLEMTDADGAPPNDESTKAYFVCRRKVVTNDSGAGQLNG
jgi:SAM-dependent methyltransferase